MDAGDQLSVFKVSQFVSHVCFLPAVSKAYLLLIPIYTCFFSFFLPFLQKWFGKKVIPRYWVIFKVNRIYFKMQLITTMNYSTEKVCICCEGTSQTQLCTELVAGIFLFVLLPLTMQFCPCVPCPLIMYVIFSFWRGYFVFFWASELNYYRLEVV